MFSNFITVIDIIVEDTNKALSFGAVTIFNPVWVVKNQILDCFLFNSVLARPQIASAGARKDCRRPRSFQHTLFHPLLRAQRPKSLSLPGVCRELSINRLCGTSSGATDSQPQCTSHPQSPLCPHNWGRGEGSA